jgi:hypothetical protein
MSNNSKISCAYCDFVRTTRYYIKHFNEHHRDTITKDALKRGARAKAVVIKIKGDNASAYCCFGCNAVWKHATVADNHMLECEHREQHKSVCRELLGESQELVEASALELKQQEITTLSKKLDTLSKRMRNREIELLDNYNHMVSKFNRFLWGWNKLTGGQLNSNLAFLLCDLNHPPTGAIDWNEILSEPPTAQYNYNKDESE